MRDSGRPLINLNRSNYTKLKPIWFRVKELYHYYNHASYTDWLYSLIRTRVVTVIVDDSHRLKTISGVAHTYIGLMTHIIFSVRDFLGACMNIFVVKWKGNESLLWCNELWRKLIRKWMTVDDLIDCFTKYCHAQTLQKLWLCTWYVR